MKKRTFHFRKIEKSKILQKTFAVLAGPSHPWVTTKQIQRHTGSGRVSSDVSEVRANGHDITAVLDRVDERTGARVYRYRMLW